jgi:glutamine amidotransferase
MGLGNFDSVVNALLKNGIFAESFNAPNSAERFEILIFPGVGNWTFAARRLEETGFAKVMQNHVASGRGLIGICLGMQMLGTLSDEGPGQGLGLLDFKVHSLGLSTSQSSMGWAVPSMVRAGWLETVNSTRYYFVHSYGVKSTGASWERMTYRPGKTAIVAAIQYKNIIGFQFHPERSLQPGLDILSRAVISLEKA